MARKMINKRKKKVVVKNKKSTKKLVKKALTKTKLKKKKVLSTPKGYNSITPYLVVDNAVKAIEFYKKVFDAKEVMRMEQPSGKIGHAELKIGNSKIMLSDMCSESNGLVRGDSVSLYLYVKDVDAVTEKAVKSGAELLRPIENMFYGDRSGELKDPYGYRWCIATHIEELTPAKMKKRAAEFFSNNQG